MDYRGTHTWFDTALVAYTVRNGGSVNSYIALHSIKGPRGFGDAIVLSSVRWIPWIPWFLAAIGSQCQVPGHAGTTELPKHSEREQFAPSLCHFKQGAFLASDGQGIKAPNVWSNRFRKSGSQSISGRMARRRHSRRGSLIASQGWLT